MLKTTKKSVKKTKICLNVKNSVFTIVCYTEISKPTHPKPVGGADKGEKP